uniref:Uncharacterized protein n=1 Tax=Myotis myotis TaxID=51298 RepID=A0A7J7ZXB2_MYOMY|nr:hypothetical protein mMyoMyo1_009613 [Myotis myotis]
MVEPPQPRRQKGPSRRNRGPAEEIWRQEGRRGSEQTLAQTGPGPVTPSHNPATTGRAGKALLLHPDFFLPAQFHLPQPLTREHPLSEINPLSATWFLTYIGAWTLLQHQKLQPPWSFYWGKRYGLPEWARALGKRR